MNLNGVHIDDTFAEAFGMKATRVLVTAQNLKWAYHAANPATGFATSVIACGCEAGVERKLDPSETPDGRPGASMLFFAMSGKELAKQVERRVGQCVLTAPTSAAFAGIDEGEPIALGKNLRFFGDGFQLSKVIGGKRYWRVPVMDGEFLVRGDDRHGQGRRWRQFPDSRRHAAASARGLRSGDRGNAEGPECDHAVPGRRGALGLQGRLEVQGSDGFDQRCFLSDHTRHHEIGASRRASSR